MEGILLRKFINSLFMCSFLVYLFVWAMVIFDGIVLQKSIDKSFIDFFTKHSNFDPFRSFVEIFYGRIKISQLVDILLKSFVLFIPMGIFLPTLFEGMNKPRRYFSLISILMLIILVYDVFFIRGCIDIEKVFLCVLGACLGFLISRNENIRCTLYFIGYRRTRKRIKYSDEIKISIDDWNWN